MNSHLTACSSAPLCKSLDCTYVFCLSFCIQIAQAVTAVTLALIMYGRYTKTGKFMPGGLVAALSAVMIVVYVARIFGASNKHHAS
jgi:hypothetical protein